MHAFLVHRNHLALAEGLEGPRGPHSNNPYNKTAANIQFSINVTSLLLLSSEGLEDVCIGTDGLHCSAIKANYSRRLKSLQLHCIMFLPTSRPPARTCMFVLRRRLNWARTSSVAAGCIETWHNKVGRLPSYSHH